METSSQISCKSLEQLPVAAAEVVAFAKAHQLTVWLLEGVMGAGKTTFTKALCKELGVEDIVQSPTFSIVNEYRTRENEPVYHFDFYRIHEVAEAIHIGAEDYFYSGHLCLIEWPSKVEAILPDTCLHIHIEVNKDFARNILLSIIHE